MTLDEIRKSEKKFLTPRDIAPLLGVKPYTINAAARAGKLVGFPYCLIGSRVLVPREPFIRWFEGRV